MTDFRTRFRSISDASMRHASTYIGIMNSDGLITPKYIEEVTGRTRNPTLRIRNIAASSVQEEILMGDPTVVLKRPEIGMANVQCNITRKTYAVWYESMAVRQVKRTLDFRLLNKKFIGTTSFINHDISTSSNSNRSKILDAFYNSRYPKYTECLESIREGRNVSMAFAKRFALSVHPTCGIVVYYKDILIGYIEDDVPVLLPQFQYLAEFMEESSYAYE